MIGFGGLIVYRKIDILARIATHVGGRGEEMGRKGCMSGYPGLVSIDRAYPTFPGRTMNCHGVTRLYSDSHV